MNPSDKSIAVERRVIRRMHLATISCPPNQPGAGLFKQGNILLLGEQASDPINDPDQKPFCSTRACSGWLNWQMELHNLEEDHFFWLNVLNNDGTAIDLNAAVARLRPSAIISLGNIARNACVKSGITPVHFSHPQYWKRFRSKELYPLIPFLVEKTKNLHRSSLGLV
jgi:hypothetical protein